MNKKTILRRIRKKQKRAFTTIRKKQKKAFTTIRTKRKQAYTSIRKQQRKAFTAIHQKQQQAMIALRDQVHRRKKVMIKIALMALVVALISITIGRSLFFDQKPGLYSFAIINFAGYLFFLIMPVEALMPYYLSQGYQLVLVISIAVITALIALLIDYFIGTLVSSAIINDLIGEKQYHKVKRAIERYGLLAVFLSNLFPLSSDIIVLVAGMLRLKAWKVMLYSFIGLTIKYLFIAYIFSFF